MTDKITNSEWVQILNLAGNTFKAAIIEMFESKIVTNNKRTKDKCSNNEQQIEYLRVKWV